MHLPSPQTSSRWIAAILAGVILAACGSGGGGSPGGLQRFPTAIATSISPIATPTAAAEPTPTPEDVATPIATVPPALALPDGTGTSVACPANTLRISLAEGGRVSVVSRIAASGDSLYLLVDGGMYRTPVADAEAGVPVLEPILTPEQEVASRPIHELVDLAVDEESGVIYALDKIGHVFRYEPEARQAALAYRAGPTDDEPDDLPYDFIALTLDAAGRVILLDSAHGALWTPTGLAELEIVNEARGLTASADLTSAGERFYTLQQNGTIRTSQTKTGSDDWRDAEGTRLGVTLFTSRHLGVEVLYLVDGLRRQVDGIMPVSGQPVTRHVFAFPQMGMLQDVVFAGGRMFAVADTDLYVYPGPATDSGGGACPPPPDPDALARPTLYGYDVLALTDRLIYPIVGGSLPPWTRVYPGASRIYRMGVHHGVDIYAYNAPRGFRTGYPVMAMGDGQVMRATIIYDEFTEEEFDQMLADSDAAGMTPPEILDRLEGKQVIIDHGNGVQTVYAHLDEIAPGVVTGAKVEAGQIIGSVGVTGTQGEAKPGAVGPHLHFEIWLGDRYLGFGLTTPETMWWFAQIFPDEVE